MGTTRIDELRNETKDFLLSVSRDTLDESYDKLINILLRYKGDLSKNDVYDVFISLDKEMQLSIYQEEVLWDISNRLGGQCSPGKEIEW